MKFNQRLSNYPTYRSPIRTFQELGISTENIDPNQLRLERKRLLLEIQISDTQTTQIGEKVLGKNDVIELFDELERISNIDYHIAIFNHPVLLTFLEEHKVSGTIKKEHKIFFDTVEKWERFIAFISPYMAAAIDKLLSKVISRVNFKDLMKISSFFKLLTSEDAFFAFRKFNNFCQTLEDRLENLSLRRTTFPAADVGFLRDSSFYDCVNEISKFYPNLPDSVASDVINFTVNSERSVGRGKSLVLISDQARRLHCSAQLGSIIISNRAAFDSSKEETASFNANKTWRLLVGIVIFALVVFRATNRCESRSNQRYEYPNQELLDKIRSINRDGEINYINPARSRKNSEPKEFDFLDLHEHVLACTQLSEYSDQPDTSTIEPTIYSKLTALDHGSSYKLTNETTSDMLMVVWSGSNLTSHFAPAGSSIEFSASPNSSMFFYSGERWKNNRTIEFKYLKHSSKEVPVVRFNGYFSLWQEKNIAFLRKFFTLTDGESNDFKIINEDDSYQFYQGDRHVNYSF